jgi:hypothetical protein
MGDKDNIIIETVEFSEELYLKNIQENQFPEPEDGLGGEKDEDN